LPNEQYFPLFREYTAKYALNPKSSRLNITDICLLMAIRLQCSYSNHTSRTSQPILKGMCQKPLSYFEEQFFLSRTTVWRSLDKLRSPEFNLIKLTNDNKFSKSATPTISLLHDFEQSTTPVTDQNLNEADTYTGKSTFVKVYLNTFKKEFLNGRELSATDILIYNIIYSYIYNNRHNTEEEFNRPLSDISIFLPVDTATISRSLENLKHYDLISKNLKQGRTTSTSNTNRIKIITDITKGPAEEYFEW